MVTAIWQKVMAEAKELQPLGWYQPAKKYNGDQFKFPIYKELQTDCKSQRAKVSFLTFQPTTSGLSMHTHVCDQTVHLHECLYMHRDQNQTLGQTQSHFPFKSSTTNTGV